MLEVLRKKILYVNLKECIFAWKKLFFLVILLVKKCIKMDEENMKIIQEWSMSK
jgi:hypothetical protein